jgi:hypothetical protein
MTPTEQVRAALEKVQEIEKHASRISSAMYASERLEARAAILKLAREAAALLQPVGDGKEPS